MAKIAVVGAGIAGLVAARKMQVDHDVQIFDKSRGAGGRVATRYAGPYEFDHGAPFFSARTRKFKSFLEPLLDLGVVSRWPARLATFDNTKRLSTSDLNASVSHYVAAPRMNAIGKHLVKGLDVHYSITVTSIKPARSKWVLFDQQSNRLGVFDWLILAMPAAQSMALMPADAKRFQTASKACMQPCFTLMLGFSQPMNIDWEVASLVNSQLSQVVINSRKPGRSKPFTLVAHSTNHYAQLQLEQPRELVTNELLTQVAQVVGLDYREPDFKQLHRWLYATSENSALANFYHDVDTRVSACGDWLCKDGVEGAFTSGDQLSDAQFSFTG